MAGCRFDLVVLATGVNAHAPSLAEIGYVSPAPT